MPIIAQMLGNNTVKVVWFLKFFFFLFWNLLPGTPVADTFGNVHICYVITTSKQT